MAISLAKFGSEEKRSETNVESKRDKMVCMAIDENGKVVPESMTTFEDMKSDEQLILYVKKCEPLLNNWQPGIYKGKPVKSRVNLPIKIKD